MVKTQLTYKFTSSSKVGEDLFESKAQENVATSMHEYISSKNSPSRLIGLDGRWGSGKSNIIAILEKQMRGTHLFYTYDAWSHQEDLQRRSFLEGLTDFLEVNHLFASTWNHSLKDLLAKKKEVTTKTIPKISPAFFYLFFATLLLPVANSIAALDKVDSNWKVFIASLPIFGLIIIYGIARYMNDEYKDLNKLLYIYKDQDISKTTMEVISESEPSVREFQGWINKIDLSLKSPIVVVFDNMDRISPDKVRKYWSTIHTFFSQPDLNNIWLIVPFDRYLISKAFEEDADSFEYISKTFNIVFIVPEVILTDWQIFFKIKYEEVFGTGHINEYAAIISIFDRHHDIITPRKILTFLNDCLIIANTTGKKIGLQYVALFVANRKEILKDPVNAIITESYLLKVKRQFSSDDYVSEKVAAIVYGIKEGSARQAVLSREIIVAIREKNRDKIIELAGQQQFYTLLCRIMHDDIDPDSIVYSLHFLENLEKTESETKEYELCWELAIQSQIYSPLEIQVFDQAHSLLLSHVKKSKLKQLVSYFLNSYFDCREFDGEKYFDAINALDNLVNNLYPDFNIDNLIKNKTVSKDVFIPFIRKAKYGYKKFKLETNIEELDKYFRSQIINGSDDYLVIEYLESNRFPETISEIERLINSYEITGLNMARVFSIYKLVSPTIRLSCNLTPNIIEILRSGVNEDSEEFRELLAMCMAYPNSGDFSITFKTYFNTANDALAKLISEKVLHYVDLEDLLINQKVWPNSLNRRVAIYLIENPPNYVSIDISRVLPHFDEIADVLGISYEVLFNFLDHYAEENMFTSVINDAVLLLSSHNYLNCSILSETKLAKETWLLVNDYFNSRNADVWKSIFQEEGLPDFRIFERAVAESKISKFPNFCHIAFEEALTRISKQQQSMISIGTWKDILGKVKVRSELTFYRDIRDNIIRSGEHNTLSFILFERFLFQDRILEEKADDIIRTVIIPGINDLLLTTQIEENLVDYKNLILASQDNGESYVLRIWDAVEVGDSQSALNLSNIFPSVLNWDVKIISAFYTTDEKSIELTTFVQDLISRGIFHFKVGNNFLTPDFDIHPGVLKYLNVIYWYRGEQKSIAVPENEFIRIPIL